MIALLLLVNVAFAKEKVHKHPKKQPARTEVAATPFLLTKAEATTPDEVHVVKPQTDSVQATTLTENLMRPNNFHRTGTGVFMVGMIGSVTAVAMPVQQFILDHSSYDSGANEFSWPAVHIKPNVRRGSAWMSMQLRF